eukprot:TRINITY_DN9906_c0_g3_i2.p1 TRINITY_DN9906_c0_g3~~TRINITY_DN9906_c0_g3_i2.p1  ORF type:complete len:115 (-),score=9.46 TRINITY_DN9906_c0_g3_i2:68-412(-)
MNERERERAFLIETILKLIGSIISNGSHLKLFLLVGYYTLYYQLISDGNCSYFLRPKHAFLIHCPDASLMLLIHFHVEFNRCFICFDMLIKLLTSLPLCFHMVQRLFSSLVADS